MEKLPKFIRVQKGKSLMEIQCTIPVVGSIQSRLERVETSISFVSQLCGQFMTIRNYAKDIDGLFTQIIEGRLAHLQSYNTSTIKIANPLARLNMR